MNRRADFGPWEKLTLAAAVLILVLYTGAFVLNAIDRTYQIPTVLNGLVPMVIGALLGPSAIAAWRGRNGKDGGE